VSVSESKYPTIPCIRMRIFRSFSLRFRFFFFCYIHVTLSVHRLDWRARFDNTKKKKYVKRTAMT
jgi:hypothetical protein